MEHERLHCLSNPSTFLIKEMVIGINTADILMDLSKQETSRGQSGDRMGRLTNHILQQRSYYPMCPPAPGLNLVYEQMDKLSLPISPDIMVLPSDLRFFAKNVRETRLPSVRARRFHVVILSLHISCTLTHAHACEFALVFRPSGFLSSAHGTHAHTNLCNRVV